MEAPNIEWFRIREINLSTKEETTTQWLGKTKIKKTLQKIGFPTLGSYELFNIGHTIVSDGKVERKIILERKGDKDETNSSTDIHIQR